MAMHPAEEKLEIGKHFGVASFAENLLTWVNCGGYVTWVSVTTLLSTFLLCRAGRPPACMDVLVGRIRGGIRGARNEAKPPTCSADEGRK